MQLAVRLCLFTSAWPVRFHSGTRTNRPNPVVNRVFYKFETRRCPWGTRISRTVSDSLYFHEHDDLTGSDLYGCAKQLAEQAGWEYGGPIAGHLIGVFPHEKIPGDKISLYVHPENHNRMRTPDASGRQRHWILEIHFVDRPRQIGGFYEELLTIG